MPYAPLTRTPHSLLRHHASITYGMSTSQQIRNNLTEDMNAAISQIRAKYAAKFKIVDDFDALAKESPTVARPVEPSVDVVEDRQRGDLAAAIREVVSDASPDLDFTFHDVVDMLRGKG